MYEVFNYLEFSSIQTLSSVNHFLRSVAILRIRPNFLGIFTTQIWSNYILPYFDYFQLKKFQRVSQIAKKLTLSKSFAEILFRSDVDIAFLARVQPNTQFRDRILSSRITQKSINPLFKAMNFVICDSYDSIYISLEASLIP